VLFHRADRYDEARDAGQVGRGIDPAELVEGQ
jgi:hypothetical protein